jgi:hypothetical protein
LRSQLKEGEFYIGDRYYGEDYALFSQLDKAGCSYLLRLRQEAVFEAVESWPLSAADQRASVYLRWFGALRNKEAAQP